MPNPSLFSGSPVEFPLSASRGVFSSENSDDELREHLRRVISTRAPGLVDAALRLVTTLASVIVRGADGVSITLERHGALMTVAASDETVLQMDEHQYHTGEGPCLAAASQGHCLEIESLASEERWPLFVPRAFEQGIACILSTPVLVSAFSVGALNIYSRTESAFGTAERDVAAGFAGQVAEILAEVAEVAEFDEEQGQRISAAPASRDIIAMAQGVYMSRLGVSEDAAAAVLHWTARDKRITVRDEATAVLDSTRTGMDESENHRG